VARKLFLMIGIAAVALAFSGPSAIAQSFNGTWRGQINCGKLSFASGPRRFPMIVRVSANSATYSRQVRDRARKLVGTEEGTGAVDGNGAIELTAKWISARANSRITYTASYRGSMHPSTANLQGTQVWMRGGQTESRGCSISLSR